ncbi:MAG: N-acetylmuramoyl-L-alanine amidase [Oscillospiraceae bacterium]|jgi:N-acetylmuramoyl-L-alanine amidase|nr:N-acetylmuramoyl-L-alanine amidase [Oscillospiraceae bacterium]
MHHRPKKHPQQKRLLIAATVFLLLAVAAFGILLRHKNQAAVSAAPNLTYFEEQALVFLPTINNKPGKAVKLLRITPGTDDLAAVPESLLEKKYAAIIVADSPGVTEAVLRRLAQTLTEQAGALPIYYSFRASQIREDSYREAIAAVKAILAEQPTAKLLLTADNPGGNDAARWAKETSADVPVTWYLDTDTYIQTGSLDETLALLTAAGELGGADLCLQEPKKEIKDSKAAKLWTDFLAGKLTPSDATRRLTMRRPALDETNMKTNKPSFVLEGAASPRFPLEINGKKIDVPEGGAFSAEYALNPGKNIFTITHRGAEITYEVEYTKTLLSGSEPVGEVSTAGGMDLYVYAYALEGAAVTAELAGVQIELTAAEGFQKESGGKWESGFVTYTGVFPLPASAEKAQKLGSIRYTAVLGKEKERMEGASVTVLAQGAMPGGGSAKIVTVTADYAHTRPVILDDASNPHYSPLPKGTVDYLAGYSMIGEDSYYHLASGRRVSAEDVQLLDGDVLQLSQLTATAALRENELEMRFQMDRCLPFNIDMGGQSYRTQNNAAFYVQNGCTVAGLSVTFFYTQAPQGEIQTAGGVLDKAAWSYDKAAHIATLTLHCAKAGYFWGWSAYWDGTTLILRIKHRPPQTLQGAVILLDPGHGGKDVGAIGNTTESTLKYEADLNLLLAQKTANVLRARGAEVYLTRDDNSEPLLADRVAMLRKLNPDVYISIHHDSNESPAVQGTTAYYYRATSEPLASAIHARLMAVYRNTVYPNQSDVRDLGTRFYPFRVTRVEECPSVLIEYGHISNAAETAACRDSAVQDAFAVATADGIADFLGR